jgi:hypothetical protein
MGGKIGTGDVARAATALEMNPTIEGTAEANKSVRLLIVTSRMIRLEERKWNIAGRRLEMAWRDEDERNRLD